MGGNIREFGQPQIFGGAINNNGNGAGGGNIGPFRNVSFSGTIIDPEVLNCSICNDSLTIPVFQCEYGHLACSFCCSRVFSACPSCHSPIGHIRNMGLERLLQSMVVSCLNIAYGCTATMKYSKMLEHQKTCLYSPCSCPFVGCNYVGSSYSLNYQHFPFTHPNAAVKFRYGRVLRVTLNVSSIFLVLQEEEHSDLFILNNCVTHIGMMVSISRISNTGAPGCFYNLMGRLERDFLGFNSFTKIIQKVDENSISNHCLLVPFEDFHGQFVLDICMWKHGVFPPNFQN